MKQSRIKRELRSLKKREGISKKLSKQEENKALLSIMSQRKTGEIEEEPLEQKQSRRTFICPCGCQVTLEGEVYKRKIKDGYELCSKCAE